MLPHPALLSRDGQAGEAKIAPDRQARSPPGLETGVATGVAGNEEGATFGIGQLPLDGLRAFGEAERRLGLAIEPGNRSTGDKPGLAGVLRADAEAVDVEQPRREGRSATLIATDTGPA